MKRFLLLLTLLVLLAGCAAETPAPAEPTVAPAEPTTAAVASVPVSAVAGMRTFAVVPGESTASYLVDEEFFAAALTKYNILAGKSVTVGSTQEVAGSLALELGADQPLGPNRFTVDLPSLTSDQSLRDGWIRDNALESNKFPEAVFVATSISGAPESYTDGTEVSFQLVGDLTVRSISLPATFDVTATLNGDTITGVAEAKVKMSDFGVTPPNFANTLMVADLFTIRIELTAKEQK
ncbi:MAG: YceI family protein [Chloroflexi bacterium]|nr:MAG: YceI family protein [Chloroflexota bacterium]